jgi:hypothetical protein
MCELNILGTHIETLASFLESGYDKWYKSYVLYLARMDALKDTYFHKTICQNSCLTACLFKMFYLHSPNSKVVDGHVCLPTRQTFWRDRNSRASTVSGHR